jgi:hypothetical protein
LAEVNQIAQTRNLSDPLTLEFFKPRVVKKLKETGRSKLINMWQSALDVRSSLWD